MSRPKDALIALMLLGLMCLGGCAATGIPRPSFDPIWANEDIAPMDPAEASILAQVDVGIVP